MLHHIALELRAEDADRFVGFLGLLGFAEVAPPPTLADRTVWAQAPDGTQVHLLLTGEPVAPPAGHVAVVAADYEATLARLREAGYRPEPRQEHWGSPRAFVSAPGGHRVELMAHPPRS